MVKADLTSDDISVLKRWGGNMKKAKVNKLRLVDIQDKNCAYCKHCTEILILLLGGSSGPGKPAPICKTACPIMAFTGKWGCKGTPWHPLAEKLTVIQDAKAGAVMKWIEDGDPSSKIKPIDPGLYIGVYDGAKAMFKLIVRAINSRIARGEC